jgi:hypothetical protein
MTKRESKIRRLLVERKAILHRLEALDAAVARPQAAPGSKISWIPHAAKLEVRPRARG